MFAKIRELKLPRWGRLALGAALSASLLLPGVLWVRSSEEAPPPPAEALTTAREIGSIETASVGEAEPRPKRKPFADAHDLSNDTSENDRPDTIEGHRAGLRPTPIAVGERIEPPIAQNAPAATSLLGVETSTSPDGSRSLIRLQADGSISNPDVIALANPDRLVIDLPAMVNVMGASRVEVGSDRVARVRVGEHDGMVRVVLDGGDGAEGFESRLVEPTYDGLRVTLASRGVTLEPAPRAAPLVMESDSERDEETVRPGPPTQPVASIAPGDVPALANVGRELPQYLMADQAKRPQLASGEALDDRYDCIIEPYEMVEVGSALTAVVESVDVERSDFVSAGQVLAQLEASPERATVAVANARAKMDGDLLARRARMELGGRKRARADQLFESEALSADMRDEIRTEADVAKAVVKEAREHKELMKLEYHEAYERLREHTIRSPVNGVVVDRLKSPGEVVKEETIVVLAQIDPLRVEVILPAAVFGAIEHGMRAEVIPELPNAGVQVASVTVVDRVVDGTSGTFGVRLELANSDHAVPSGLRCQVRFLKAD